MDHENRNAIYLTQKTFVFNAEGKFLTMLRTATAPTRPLTWDLPGGAFESDETPDEGARREIQEETNLEVGPLQPISVKGERGEDGQFWVTVAYRAEAHSTEVVLSYEHQEYRWVTPQEFPELPSSAKWQEIVRECFS